MCVFVCEGEGVVRLCVCVCEREGRVCVWGEGYGVRSSRSH